MSPRYVSVVAALSLVACVDAGAQFRQRQAEDQQQVALGCARQLTSLHDTYCAKPMSKPPVGMSENITRQRNSIAVSCKDGDSASKLATIDACIQEIHAHE